jgi:hypothetical protein
MPQDFESPFLNVHSSEWIAANDLAFAIFDKFPISKGHALVVSNSLIPYEESPREKRSCQSDPRRTPMTISPRSQSAVEPGTPAIPGEKAMSLAAGEVTRWERAAHREEKAIMKRIFWVVPTVALILAAWGADASGAPGTATERATNREGQQFED